MSTCRSCGAKLKWIKTKAGKNIPVDPEHVDWADADVGMTLVREEDGTVATKDTEDSRKRGTWYTSHFATCPDADDWRERNRSRSKAKEGVQN